MYTASLLDAKSAGVGKVADNCTNKCHEASLLAAEKLQLLVHVVGHGLCTVVDLKFNDARSAPNLVVKPLKGAEAIEVAAEDTTVVRHDLPLSPNDKVVVMVSVNGYVTTVALDKEATGRDGLVDKVQEAVTHAMDRAGEPDDADVSPKALRVDIAVKSGGNNVFYCSTDLGLFYSPWSAAETVVALLKQA